MEQKYKNLARQGYERVELLEKALFIGIARESTVESGIARESTVESGIARESTVERFARESAVERLAVRIQTDF